MITEIEQYRIEKICNRLKKSVTPIDVINWLGNFKPYEKDKALLILENLEYITENEIIELYEQRFSKLLQQLPNQTIVIHPVSEYGKSSTLMVYYLKKTPSYKLNELRIKFYSDYSNFKHKILRTDFSVIFLDDFSGSGNQFNKYYQTFIKPQLSSNSKLKSLYFLTLIYLPRAKSLIERYNSEIEVIGEIRYPVFLTNKSVFGDRNHMIPIRQFCYSYGEKLFSVYNRDKQIEEKYPLGYNNSQALIIFAYNSPNNTLPIIWSSKNWKPLYPRLSQQKISDSKLYRKQLAHEIGLLRTSDISTIFYSGEKDLGWKSITFITKTDFIIYSIIRFLKQKRAIPVICQILGITEKDYNDYIFNKPEIFSGLASLTEYGEELYIKVKKQLKFVKNDMNESYKDNEIKQTKYLPKEFKGVS